MIDSPPDIEKIDNNNGPCATDSDCPSNLECINHGCVKKNQNIGRDYEEVLDNYLEIEISQMTKRHSYELATVLKVEENESNLRILYSFNVVHLRTFIEKVLMKREIRLEERREIRRVRLNLKTNLEMNQDGNELIITH